MADRSGGCLPKPNRPVIPERDGLDALILPPATRGPTSGPGPLSVSGVLGNACDRRRWREPLFLNRGAAAEFVEEVLKENDVVSRQLDLPSLSREQRHHSFAIGGEIEVFE